jgi:hypothetical protein
VQFLVDHFSFLGLAIQNWMLVAVGLVAASIVLAWKSRDRS